MRGDKVADEWTGRERVLAVLRGEEPDRVPTFEWDIDSGLLRQMTTDGTYEGFLDTYGLDAVICGPSYARRPAGDGRIIDEWGVTRAQGHEDYAMPVDALAPIANWSDLERWEPPDPYLPGRFERMRAQIARFKGRKAVLFRARDVWSSPRELLGYTQLLIDCLDRPQLVEALVIKCVDHSIAIVRIAAELGAEVVITGDDIADSRGPLVSPELWESLFLPHFRRLVRAAHECGLTYWKHTDGNITDLMDGKFIDIIPFRYMIQWPSAMLEETAKDRHPPEIEMIILARQHGDTKGGGIDRFVVMSLCLHLMRHIMHIT